MTFDELWRLHLARDRHPDDSVKEQETAGMYGAAVESPDQLKLTAEDCEFLSQLGIKP